MRTGDFEAMVAKQIRVVQMLPELHAGGVERGTLELGTYLSAQGHQSIVISGGGRMVPELKTNGSRHISWPVGRKSPITLKYLLPLRRFLAQEAIDVLHVRSRVPAWIAFWAWKSLPESVRPRFITTFHGYYSVNRYSAIMTKGERVIAISKGIRSHMIEQYGVEEERIDLIYRGVDERIFDPAMVSNDRMKNLQKHWQIENVPQPLIILPGRLTPWKGQDIFIQSLSQIKDLQWTALCIGDKEENASHFRRLQQMVSQLGLEGRIRFVGHCEDMPAAIMLSDVVVSASSLEPEAFGRVVVEAQAMSKPVIATAHGGSLETILDDKSGWLVPPQDTSALSEALSKAIQNKDLRQQFGREGRKWVMDNFTIHRMCQKTLNVYEQILNRSLPN